MAVVIGVEVCVDASVVPLVAVELLVTDLSEVVSLLVVVVAAVAVSLVVAKVDIGFLPTRSLPKRSPLTRSQCFQ